MTIEINVIIANLGSVIVCKRFLVFNFKKRRKYENVRGDWEKET